MYHEDISFAMCGNKSTT